MHFIEFSSSRDTNSFALISEQSDDYFSLPLDQDDLPNTRGPTFFPPYNLTVPDGGSQVNHSLMAEYPIEQYSPRNHVTSVDSDSQPIDMFLSLPSLDEGSNLSDLRLFPYASSLFEPTSIMCNEDLVNAENFAARVLRTQNTLLIDVFLPVNSNVSVRCPFVMTWLLEMSTLVKVTKSASLFFLSDVPI